MKLKLINIGLFLLFYFVCSCIVYVMATMYDYIHIGIMTLWWQSSGISVLVLVVLLFIMEHNNKLNKRHKEVKGE